MNPIQSFDHTRQLLLLGIKRRGSASVVDLVGDTPLSAAATRRHLGDLARDGYVSISHRVEGPGRPRSYYALTPKGESVFTKNYRWVADAALSAVKEEGPDVVARILGRMVEMNVASGTRRLSGKPDIERVTDFKGILAEQGFFPALTRTSSDEFELVILNCPLDGLLSNHPELCQVELDCFAGVFETAKVARTTSRREGSQACRFVIHLAAPD